jgi:hypothetical protein
MVLPVAGVVSVQPGAREGMEVFWFFFSKKNR